MTHDELVNRAEKWLKTYGCGVVFRDEFRPITSNREQPDAIGWVVNTSILVECKATRSDFLKDKKKLFRKNPEQGMGDWRFFMCPPGLIKVEDLPSGWGLLYVYPKSVKKVHGVPKKMSHTSAPFVGNKLCEQQMMYAALRRLELRGHMPTIYDKENLNFIK